MAYFSTKLPMDRLASQVATLKTLVPFCDKKKESVSDATVGWHIYHCLLVVQSFVKLMAASDPQQFQPKFSFLKYFLLGTGFLPRGKAKAPSRVVPREEPHPDQLLLQIEAAYKALEALPQMPPVHFMDHPIFGHLRKKEAIRFVAIHTQHHLKIIRDILANA